MNKKESVILFIDTADNKKVDVGLSINGKKISKSRPNTWTSQLLLPMIDEILKENKIKLTDITEIKINTGPGSFTGLRVGIAMANTLAYLLKIPINGSQKKTVEPVY